MERKLVLLMMLQSYGQESFFYLGLLLRELRIHRAAGETRGCAFLSVEAIIWFKTG